MQIRQFEYVMEIARQGSIKRAAEKLYISQQALSETLKLLEEKLGFSIFQRTNKGVVPTANGAKVLRDIEEILSKVYSWGQYQEEKPNVQLFIQCILSDLLLDNNFTDSLYNLSAINLEFETASPEEIIERVSSGEPALVLLSLNEAAKAYQQLQRIAFSKSYKVEMISDSDALNVCMLMQKAVCPAEMGKLLTESDIIGKTLVVNTEMLVIEPIQKLLKGKKTVVRGVPRSVKPMDLILQDENIVTYMPQFLADNNRYVKNGTVVVRQLEQDVEDKWYCYLLYNAKLEQTFLPVIQEIKNFFSEII